MAKKPDDFWDDVAPGVDPDLCQRCADCPSVAACPVQGLRRDDADGVPVVDKDFCLGCYSCVEACPHGAIIPPRC